MFEVRIHPLLYKILNIVEICKEPSGEEVFTPPVVDDMDLSKLGRIMDGIDYTEVRKHKTVRIRLYLISQWYEHGVSFTDMLTLLAHPSHTLMKPESWCECFFLLIEAFHVLLTYSRTTGHSL